MREILFRGKKIDNDEWTYGFYFEHSIDGQKYSYIKYQTFDEGFVTNEVVADTVGQYTGLTDKNGKKIFEGDIIKYKNTDGIKFNGVALTVIGKVVYNEKNASFAISGKDEIGAKHYDYFPIKNIEVIGNIHDNPELLK